MCVRWLGSACAVEEGGNLLTDCWAAPAGIAAPVDGNGWRGIGSWRPGYSAAVAACRNGDADFNVGVRDANEPEIHYINSASTMGSRFFNFNHFSYFLDSVLANTWLCKQQPQKISKTSILARIWWNQKCICFEIVGRE